LSAVLAVLVVLEQPQHVASNAPATSEYPLNLEQTTNIVNPPTPIRSLLKNVAIALLPKLGIACSPSHSRQVIATLVGYEGGEPVS
jgi:hypothetical protein